jgi:hypothetical protein
MPGAETKVVREDAPWLLFNDGLVVAKEQRGDVPRKQNATASSDGILFLSRFSRDRFDF